MRGLKAATAAIVWGGVFITSVDAAIDPIVVKGSKFFSNSSGAQFFIKGVTYQEQFADIVNGDTSYIDPLADGGDCQRDIPYLQELGTNTVRVYAVDTGLSHDDCMNQFADAGIYVIADLGAPGAQIEGESPAWNDTLYDRYTSVIDTLQGYPNTLGFFVGNEVITETSDTNAAPFVKAAIRDMKQYVIAKGYRAIPMGYSTADVADLRNVTADYFNCGEQHDAVDFFGLNSYAWCSPSSYTESGWNELTEQFTDYSVPVFLSEYGCNVNEPRSFDEVAALYGPQMSPVFSGGMVFEYFEEDSDYGLVEVNGAVVSTNRDFKNLASQISKVSPATAQMNAYSPSNSPASCPTQDSSWSAATVLPTPPSKAVAVLRNATANVNVAGTAITGTGTSSPEKTGVSATRASPTSSGPSGGASAKIAIGVGVGVGGAILLAVIVAVVVWRRRQRRSHDSKNAAPYLAASDNDPAVMLANGPGRHEMEQPPAEMPIGGETQELPAGHGHSEVGRRASMGPEGIEYRHEMPGNEIKPDHRYA